MSSSPVLVPVCPRVGHEAALCGTLLATDFDVYICTSGVVLQIWKGRVDCVSQFVRTHEQSSLACCRKCQFFIKFVIVYVSAVNFMTDD